MKLYAKASLERNEIMEKIRCGCDGIEYNQTIESTFRKFCVYPYLLIM